MALKEFFAGFTRRHPVFGPSTTPSYSNVAFQILSYALESITGRPFATSMQSRIFDKLHLTDTSYSKPLNDSHGVIPPGDTAAVGWDINLGVFTPFVYLFIYELDLI
jgi:CubicO group peptidase (beta-lactamase class C family)